MGRVLAAALIAAALTACTPDPKLVGQMGLAVDAHGRPVLVLAACSGAIDTVALSLLPYGSETANGEVGSWRTGVTVDGLARLPLTTLDGDWVGRPVTLAPGRHYIASAGSTRNDADALNDLTFATAQLKALRPGRVYVDADDPDSEELVPHPAANFRAWACREIG